VGAPSSVDRTCAGGCDGGRCSGQWEDLPVIGAPAARYSHSAVWTGSEMIVWGGAPRSTASYGDGASFDPFAATWQAISMDVAPSSRRDHSAV
jgi:hypothetical protein